MQLIYIKLIKYLFIAIEINRSDKIYHDNFYDAKREYIKKTNIRINHEEYKLRSWEKSMKAIVRITIHLRYYGTMKE